jgi:hypothetical protein
MCFYSKKNILGFGKGNYPEFGHQNMDQYQQGNGG